MGLLGVIRGIAAIVIGAGLAYFWSTLRPEDAFEILLGVGFVGALASFTTLYFMGKSGG